MRKMFSLKSAAIAFAFLGTATAAQAATTQYQLEATATDTNDLTTGFSITFDDLDMDMLFSLDELVSFSGPKSRSLPGRPVLPTLRGVPEITGLTDGVNKKWGFSTIVAAGTLDNNATADLYTYVLSPVPSPVPLPAGGLLLLTGLAGCAVLRRRRT